MSNSVQPHRRQPARLLCPWDSPGKNTGVGCHFLLQCMKVKSESEVAQSCPTLSDPRDWSLPDSSVHGIFQARVLEWGAIAFSGKSCYFISLSHPKDVLILTFSDSVTLGRHTCPRASFFPTCIIGIIRSASQEHHGDEITKYVCKKFYL